LPVVEQDVFHFMSAPAEYGRAGGSWEREVPMLLHTLLRQFAPDQIRSSLKNVAVRAICEDSRLVGPGDLFVARPGAKVDGRQYITDAAARGAVAVVTDQPIADSPLPQILTQDASSAASILATLFYEQPCRKVRVFGVTGTNGKTTVTYLIRHILASVSRRCGIIGTVEIDDGRTRREATMTTPGGVETAQLLASMRDKGCWSCAMEVSSHALDQGRVAGVKFAGAAFTNLTGDHLDYHKTMENYAAAKSRLFAVLDDQAVAAININDPWAEKIVRTCKARIIYFGIGRKGDYRAKDIHITSEGSRFTLVTPEGDAEVRMQLIGRHNIANALTAAALVGEVCHLSAQQIAAGLGNAPGAPGRLQPVRCGQDFAVLVDYAHTDDALENVLSALRPLTKGKLRLLFGCGGDRDRTKRSRMARIAEKLADVVYLTSDNPRAENPSAILDEIISGLSADVELSGATRVSKPRKSLSGKRIPVIVEADRRTAIERVLGEAGAGDVVLLAGKGHENYQIIGGEKRHFDDVEEATRVVKTRLSAGQSSAA
jgi:UDP-N-acetylmuramoyl-L-alanyl-D-glutamate--2,6-diaminopimelate ligase